MTKKEKHEYMQKQTALFKEWGIKANYSADELDLKADLTTMQYPEKETAENLAFMRDFLQMRVNYFEGIEKARKRIITVV